MNVPLLLISEKSPLRFGVWTSPDLNKLYYSIESVSNTDANTTWEINYFYDLLISIFLGRNVSGTSFSRFIVNSPSSNSAPRTSI